MFQLVLSNSQKCLIIRYLIEQYLVYTLSIYLIADTQCPVCLLTCAFSPQNYQIRICFVNIYLEFEFGEDISSFMAVFLVVYL